jgi:uncharacterized membrane protein HdeD (DUF308 family)
MIELLARNWAWVLMRGIFTAVFGVAAAMWPGITLFVLVVLFGAYAIVDGLLAIGMGLKRGAAGRGWLIVVGAVGVLAGLIAFLWPGITAVALVFVIAFWALVLGFAYIVKGFGLSRDQSGRWLLILSGLAGVVLGVLLLARPGEGAVSLVATIGLLAIIWGVFTVITSVRLRAIAKQLGQEGAV